MAQPLRAGIHSKDAQRHLDKYLSSEVRAKHEFSLNTVVKVEAGCKLKIQDVVIRDDKFYAVCAIEIPVSRFDKPQVNSRIGYHPETYEAGVLERFNAALPGTDLLFQLPGLGPVTALALRKVRLYRAKADFVLVNSDEQEVYFISHKGSGFPSYGGVIATFRHSLVLADFRQRLLEHVPLKQGVVSGTYGMSLDPAIAEHLDMIKSVMFGNNYATPAFGPNNVNVIMFNELRLLKQDNGFIIKSDKEILNSPAFNPLDHPLQLVAHRLAGRSDLGFADTHVMVTPVGKRRLRKLI